MSDYVAKVMEHQSRDSWERWMWRLYAHCTLKGITRWTDQPLIVDYGCGPGRFSNLLAGSSRRVWGYDHDPEMIHAARRLYPDKAMYTDVSADLPKEAWDAVFLTNVLGHVKSPVSTLRYLRGRLRSGGHLVLYNPNLRHTQMRKIPDMLSGYKPDPTLLWHWSLPQVTELIERLGFEREWHYFDGWNCLGVKSNYAACFRKI